MISVKQPRDFSHSRRAGGKSRISRRTSSLIRTRASRAGSRPGSATPPRVRPASTISAGESAITIEISNAAASFSNPAGVTMRPSIAVPAASVMRQTRTSSSGKRFQTGSSSPVAMLIVSISTRAATSAHSSSHRALNSASSIGCQLVSLNVSSRIRSLLTGLISCHTRIERPSSSRIDQEGTRRATRPDRSLRR